MRDLFFGIQNVVARSYQFPLKKKEDHPKFVGRRESSQLLAGTKIPVTVTVVEDSRHSPVKSETSLPFRHVFCEARRPGLLACFVASGAEEAPAGRHAVDESSVSRCEVSALTAD